MRWLMWRTLEKWCDFGMGSNRNVRIRGDVVYVLR